MTSYVIPGVGLLQAPTAGGTFQLPGTPGALVRVPSTGGGGGFIASWAIAARGQLIGAGRGH